MNNIDLDGGGGVVSKRYAEENNSSRMWFWGYLFR